MIIRLESPGVEPYRTIGGGGGSFNDLRDLCDMTDGDFMT